MTNEPVDQSPGAGPRLSPEEEERLRDCYHALHRLAASCRVPSVQAAARAAVAELHAALDGQALDFEYYSHRWTG